MAVAARLAKAGHRVVLHEATGRLGGAWAPTALAAARVDAAPSVLGFPAPWRDLFRKSGRSLEAELERTGHTLVPASPPRYVFADGAELILPADRGGQFTTLTSAYGRAVAEGWRDLLDGLEEVWQVLRPRGLEAELRDRRQLRGTRPVLQPRRTLEDLAQRAPHPHLAALLRSVAHRQGADPRHTPAFCAVDLWVVRTFGRWTVRGPSPGYDTGRSSVLAEALAARLRLRRVEVRLGSSVQRIEAAQSGRASAPGVVVADGGRSEAAAVISTVDPWHLVDALLDRRTGGSLRRSVHRLAPALGPAVTHELVPGIADPDAEVTETVRVDENGVPVITYTRPAAAATRLRSVHDWTRAAPHPGAGPAWSGFGDWLRRPAVNPSVTGLYLAGPFSPAGNAPSAVLLSAALAATACHAQLRSEAGR